MERRLNNMAARQEILEAAATCFMEQGFHATSLDVVARQGDPLYVLKTMMKAHAMALLEHHTFESVVVQGVQLHRFGALTPRQREELDALIALRDSFERLFKKQARAAQKAGLLAKLDISIAVKTLLGGLQWSLIWYRQSIDDRASTRSRLADAMVNTLMIGLAARAE
jgi:Tetracyclin repressor-like, C-terminal domain/Bacterial regulatory proteins, tetR family